MVHHHLLLLGAVVFQKIEEKREDEAHVAKIAATEVLHCLCILILQRESEFTPTVNFMEHSPNENDNGYA